MCATIDWRLCLVFSRCTLISCVFNWFSNWLPPTGNPPPTPPPRPQQGPRVQIPEMRYAHRMQKTARKTSADDAPVGAVRLLNRVPTREWWIEMIMVHTLSTMSVFKCLRVIYIHRYDCVLFSARCASAALKPRNTVAGRNRDTTRNMCCILKLAYVWYNMYSICRECASTSRLWCYYTALRRLLCAGSSLVWCLFRCVCKQCAERSRECKLSFTRWSRWFVCQLRLLCFCKVDCESATLHTLANMHFHHTSDVHDLLMNLTFGWGRGDGRLLTTRAPMSTQWLRLRCANIANMLLPHNTQCIWVAAAAGVGVIFVRCCDKTSKTFRGGDGSHRTACIWCV